VDKVHSIKLYRSGVRLNTLVLQPQSLFMRMTIENGMLVEWTLPQCRSARRKLHLKSPAMEAEGPFLCGIARV